MDKEEIVEEAKDIMDDFAEKLKSVEEPETFGFKKEENTRKARVVDWDDDFRQRMLDNAPKTKDGCIRGEKKKW